jgi:hypothetical protein
MLGPRGIWDPAVVDQVGVQVLHAPYGVLVRQYGYGYGQPKRKWDQLRSNIGYEVPSTEYRLEQSVLTDKCSPNAPSLTPELRQDPLQRRLLTFFRAALFCFLGTC